MSRLSLGSEGSAGGIILMGKKSCVEVMNSAIGAFSITIECTLYGQIKGWVTGVSGAY